MENDLPNTNDPYEILSVTLSDDRKTVKRAYVRLIKIYKPHKHPKEFRRIRKAYDSILEYLKLTGKYDKEVENDDVEEAENICVENDNVEEVEDVCVENNDVEEVEDVCVENDDVEEAEKITVAEITKSCNYTFEINESSVISEEIPEFCREIYGSYDDVNISSKEINSSSENQQSKDISFETRILQGTLFLHKNEEIDIENEDVDIKKNTELHQDNEDINVKKNTEPHHDNEDINVENTEEINESENFQQIINNNNTHVVNLDEIKSVETKEEKKIEHYQDTYDNKDINIEKKIELHQDTHDNKVINIKKHTEEIQKSENFQQIIKNNNTHVVKLDEIKSVETKEEKNKNPSWEEFRSQKNRFEAIKNYAYDLIENEKYEEAISLIDNDIFFQDSWKIKELGAIALQICCSVIAYIPIRGRQVADKYLENNRVTDIDMMIDVGKNLKSIPALTKFISLSFIYKKEEARFELYKNVFDNLDTYFPEFFRLEKKNLELLACIIERIEVDQELTRPPRKIKQKIFEYVSSKNNSLESENFFKNVSKMLLKIFLFILLMPLLHVVKLIFMHVMRNSHIVAVGIQILLIGFIIWIILKLHAYFKRFSSTKKVKKIVLSIFYKTDFLKFNKGQLKGLAFSTLEQISLLGKSFSKKNFNHSLVMDALIYEMSRRNPLNLPKFLVFSQMNYPKRDARFDFAKQNIDILQKKLFESPHSFLKEMTFIAEKKESLYKYCWLYIRKFSDKNVASNFDKSKESKIQKNFEFLYKKLNTVTILFLIFFFLDTSNALFSNVIYTVLAVLMCFFLNKKIIYNLIMRLKIVNFIFSDKINPKELGKLFEDQKDLSKYIKEDKALKIISLICSKKNFKYQKKIK